MMVNMSGRELRIRIPQDPGEAAADPLIVGAVYRFLCGERLYTGYDLYDEDSDDEEEVVDEEEEREDSCPNFIDSQAIVDLMSEILDWFTGGI